MIGLAHPASAQLFNCKKIMNGAKAYLKEVKDTRGTSILLKEVAADKVEADTKWGGFLTKKEKVSIYLPHPRAQKIVNTANTVINYIPAKISKKLFDDPNYRLSVFDGVYNAVIHKPVRGITRSWGKELEPRGIVKVVAGLPLAIGTMGRVKKLARNSIVEYVDGTTSGANREWADEIDNDYRYHGLKTAFLNEEMTQEQLQTEALKVRAAYQAERDYRNAHQKTPTLLDEEMKLLDQDLFADLKDAIGNDITDEQLLALFASRHRLYLDYDLGLEIAFAAPSATWNVRQIVSQTFSQPISVAYPEEASELKDLPFVQTLLSLRKQNRVNPSQLRGLIQEYSDWRAELREYEILGLDLPFDILKREKQLLKTL